jgi:hypothetical protein
MLEGNVPEGEVWTVPVNPFKAVPVAGQLTTVPGAVPAIIVKSEIAIE